MRTLLSRLAMLLFLGPGLLLLTVAGVEAQDTWSFYVTPQVWLENVRNSGFAATTNAGGTGSLQGAGYVVVPTTYLRTDGSQPTSDFFPQWGGQFAAQYGRWTFGVASQYLHYETTQDFFIQAQSIVFCGAAPLPGGGACPGPGETAHFPSSLIGAKLFTEKISTDRVDTDAAATYLFPDVIKDVLDVTTGLGFKWIRASGQRTLINNGAHVTSVPSFSYILKSCGNPQSFATSINNTPAGAAVDPGNCQRTQTSFLDQFYGMTIPTTFNLHRSRESNWQVPITISPFLGYEQRVDQVLGAANSFAAGGSFDIGVRYIFSNGIGVYAGWRGQVFNGNNLFFSQGPLFNLSVALGGK